VGGGKWCGNGWGGRGGGVDVERWGGGSGVEMTRGGGGSEVQRWYGGSDVERAGVVVVEAEWPPRNLDTTGGRSWSVPK